MHTNANLITPGVSQISPGKFCKELQSFQGTNLIPRDTTDVFRLNTLRGITKSPAVDLLMLNTSRGIKPAFSAPKGTKTTPVLFRWESP